MAWLSITKLAELTGTCAKTVRQRCEGLPSRKGERRAILYDSRQALPLILCPQGVESLSLQKERALLARAQREKLEREAERESAEWVRVDEAADLIGKFAMNLKAQLLAIPARCAPVVVNKKTIPEVHAVLEDVVHGALAEFAQRVDLEFPPQQSSSASPRMR